MERPASRSHEIREVIIPKEKAVFWMDGQGRWHNRHGPFAHRSLIAHFNASIAWDSDGYFVTQKNGDLIEKVYFRYEVTALFAVDLRWSPAPAVSLNTGTELRLAVENLYVSEDQLYMDLGPKTVKFGDRALMKLGERLDHDNGKYWLTLEGQRFPLTQRP